MATAGHCQYSGLFYFVILLTDSNTTTYQPSSSFSSLVPLKVVFHPINISSLGESFTLSLAATSFCNNMQASFVKPSNFVHRVLLTNLFHTST